MAGVRKGYGKMERLCVNSHCLTAGRWEVERGKFSIEKRNKKLKRLFDEATNG